MPGTIEVDFMEISVSSLLHDIQEHAKSWVSPHPNAWRGGEGQEDERAEGGGKGRGEEEHGSVAAWHEEDVGEAFGEGKGVVGKTTERRGG